MLPRATSRWCVASVKLLSDASAYRRIECAIERACCCDGCLAGGSARKGWYLMLRCVGSRIEPLKEHTAEREVSLVERD
jgi:hypothetical protein